MGLPKGLEGLSEGSEGLSEGPEGLPEGPEGLPIGLGETDVQMDVMMYRICPHSTGLCPLSGLLPKKSNAMFKI